MSDTALEPHRIYWVRKYIEARQWRRDMPETFPNTRIALSQYIKTLRQNWAIEKRFPSTHVAVNH